MATKINRQDIYPNTVPDFGDFVLGVDVSNKTVDPNGQVVTFTLDDIRDTIAGNIGADVAASDEVLEAIALSQAWAEGTEPGGTGTKSAQEHAADAGDSETAAATSAAQAALYDGPKFNTIALMAANDALTDGKQIVVWGGYNGEPETFVYDAGSGLTADGVLVVAATGMGAGRLISTRTTFATVADMLADRRTFAAGTQLTAAGFSYEATGSTGSLGQTNAGGQELDVLPGASGWVAEAFYDGASSFEIAWQKAIDACKAAGGGRVTLTKNHTVNDTVRVWGNFGYDGVQIDGTNVEITSTHAGPAIEFVPDARPDGGDAAPQLKQRSEIKGIAFNGPGKAVVGSSAILVRHGATVTTIRCKARGYETAYKGNGGLILRYHECEAYGNGQAIDFGYDGTFAPNDIHFSDCKLFENDRIGEVSDFPNGAVTFNKCEMEGNNTGGSNSDGVTVLYFDNAGVVNLIGSHMEVNPGEEHILFAGGAAHSALNILGGQVIPGNNNFAAVHMANTYGSQGHLHVVGARITNAATNQIYMDTGTSALIEGDTAGNVQGDLSQVSIIRRGKYTQGTTNVPANAGMRSKGSAGIAHDFEGQARFVDASNTRLGYLNNSGAAFGIINDNDNEGVQFNTKIAGASAPRMHIARSGALSVEPGGSGTTSLGSAPLRWSEVFASNGTINTSDEREKEQIGAIPDEWLDAWSDVEWSRFKWKDAVSEKGDDARWHVGLIAQQVRDVFAAHGLNALGIGLLCYDQWGDQYEEDEDGNLVLIAQAGERYGIRYDQAQALEAAFIRRSLSRLD